jgi:putative transposase
VKEVTEQLCGHEFSSSTISRMTERLDSDLEKFAQRRLEQEYPHLILDARYEKVRQDGVVGSRAVQVAIGINWEVGGACWRWSWLNARAPAAGRTSCCG